MKHIILLILICAATAINATAQNKQLKQGNKQYEKGNYKDAATAYQEALAKDPKNVTGMFNLGNALYQQKQYEAARKIMGATSKTTNEKNSKSAANYNIGNTYMHQQKWQEAVDAYKQALRNNPQDADAKYNLSYALAMMKKQQGGGGGGKDDKQQDKDKNGQNKDQQDKKGEEDKKQQDNKDGKEKDDKQDQNKDKKEEKDDNNQQRQPQPSKLSEQQAEQLLNALQQEEKNLQDKMQKSKGVPVKVEKDW